MKKKYIKPALIYVEFDSKEQLAQIYATAPDMPWDNENGEVWGENVKQEQTNIWEEEW